MSDRRVLESTPSGSAADEHEVDTENEPEPPPLPPRSELAATSTSRAASFRLSSRSSRPALQSAATTALSLTGVQASSRATSASFRSSPASRTVSRRASFAQANREEHSLADAESDDSASLGSPAPSSEPQIECDNLDSGQISGDGVGDVDYESLFGTLVADEDEFALQFQHEFDEVEDYDANGDEEQQQIVWKTKLKHFFILSASGKPIYSRHGDDHLISNHVGIAQTIISFYQGEDDSLKGFTAGDARFVFLSKGPLNLVGVSQLGESDIQIRTQLEALYAQVLSTLTLPSMERMFSHRPSTDLRRPLQGTDVLLDGLANGFTRGAPSTLLSALECLRLRKAHRELINETFLKVRSANLLYGLLVAGGRLVSVVRPKKHSLHPGDLRLIFNMLFEAGGVRGGGGENWIPICLPGFNNTGFLYMYVSFAATEPDGGAHGHGQGGGGGELAVVLIAADKEAFYELRGMRDELTLQLATNGGMTAIRTAVRRGRSTCAELLPNTALQHFLLKSRAHVQFVMPAWAPYFEAPVARRKLVSLYARLHQELHSRTSRLKVQHAVSRDAVALAWETPMYELYCVAGPHTPRTALAHGANRVIQWVRREEERVFIIGGAVF